MRSDPKHEHSGARNQGEGDRESAERYNEATRESAAWLPRRSMIVWQGKGQHQRMTANGSNCGLCHGGRER